MTTTTQAAGTLRSTSWQEEPFAEVEEAPRLSHDRVTHVFAGDLEGEGTWQNLNAYLDEASAEFVGYERVVGRALTGRQVVSGTPSTASASRGSSRSASAAGDGEPPNVESQTQTIVPCPVLSIPIDSSPSPSVSTVAISPWSGVASRRRPSSTSPPTGTAR